MRKYFGISYLRGMPALSLDLAQSISRSRLAGVPDAILVTQGWNKALAFRSLFAEALVGRWRVLCAVDEISSINGLHRASVLKPVRPGSNLIPRTGIADAQIS